MTNTNTITAADRAESALRETQRALQRATIERGDAGNRLDLMDGALTKLDRELQSARSRRSDLLRRIALGEDVSELIATQTSALAELERNHADATEIQGYVKERLRAAQVNLQDAQAAADRARGDVLRTELEKEVIACDREWRLLGQRLTALVEKADEVHRLNVSVPDYRNLIIDVVANTKFSFATQEFLIQSLVTREYVGTK